MRAYVAAVALGLLAAAAAPGAVRGVPVSSGDVVRGVIDAGGDTDTFALPLTAGSRLSVTAVAAPGSALLPEIALLTPGGTSAPIGDLLHGAGKPKVTLRSFPVTETGTWGVALRGETGTSGGYAITFKPTAPRAGGRALSVAAGNVLDFPVAGTTGALLAFTVKTKQGPTLDSFEVLDPAGDPLDLGTATVRRQGTKMSAGGIPLSGGPGVYVLRIHGPAAGSSRADVAVSVKFPKPVRRDLLLGPEPKPTAASPQVGRDGVSVRIDGTGFQPGAEIWFGDELATGIQFGSATRLDGTAPVSGASDRGDTVTLDIRNPDGQEGRVPGTFRFLGVPILRSTVPGVVPLSGGVTVTISGSNFRPGYSLLVDGSPAADATLHPGGTLSFTAAAHAAGAVSVEVTDEFGRTGALQGGLLYVPPPSLTGASPVSASFTGGRAIALQGSAFRSGNRVFVGGSEVTPVTFLGATALRIAMPAGPAGPLDVEVRDEFGQSSTVSALLRRRGPFQDVSGTAAPGAPAGTEFFASRSSLGDLDGDGAPDLVLSLPYPNYDAVNYLPLPATRLLRNDGNGAFSDATAATFPALPVAGDVGQARGLAVGDLDGDGAAEIALSMSAPIAYGSYTFTRNSKLYAYYVPGAYYAYNDFLTYGATRLLQNDGSGAFSDATSSQVPGTTSTPVFGFGERWQADASALGDLDGDGKLDLVLTASPIVQGTLAGTRYNASTSTTYLKESYAYVAGTRVLRGGASGFTAVAAPMPAVTTMNGNYGVRVREDWGGQSLALGDLDGDGDLDLALARSYPRLVYVPKQGGGYTYAYDPACHLLANDGTGVFTTGTPRLPAPYGASRPNSGDYWQADSLALGDLDGDGDLDLVQGRASLYYWYDAGSNTTKIQPAIRVFRNDGTGRMTEATSTFLAEGSFRQGGAGTILGVSTVLLGDLDGDESLDMVVSGTYYHVYDYAGSGYGYYGLLPTGNFPATKVFLNDGTGRLADLTAQWMPAAQNGDYGQSDTAVMGDLDGDGDLDLVLSSSYYPDAYGITVGHNRPLRILTTK